MLLAEEIKRIRKRLNLTQQGLADLINVNRITVVRWETDQNRPTGLYLRALGDLIKAAKERGEGRR